MLAYKLFYLASLIAFSFGALTFFVLTLYYWRHRKTDRQAGAVFPAFTLVCAAAFVANLLLRLAVQNQNSGWFAGLSLAQGLLTGILPALLFHLVLAEAEPARAAHGWWRIVLPALYGIVILAAVVHGLNDADLLPFAWSDEVEWFPNLVLGSAAALGVGILWRSPRATLSTGQRYRRWMMLLLGAMALTSTANLLAPSQATSLLPDYLVLTFFCVTLYYKERLVFFDLLIKRGAFLLVALAALMAFFFVDGRYLERLPGNWTGSWIAALLLVPLWLVAPWVHARLSDAIDRLCLRRRYTAAEAERRFIGAIQIASSEEQLQTLAAESLRDIFQVEMRVDFGGSPEPPAGNGLVEALRHEQAALGWIAAPPRTNAIPYMSDDRRLLQSLARTLGVVLENVRFREQQAQHEEREQQLRLLASRAELKALRAQINPHFLFNALNAIAGLIGSNPALADETIEQLAQVFRYTLRKSENEWVRLDEELEFVAAYLNVERARFGERLSVAFDVEPEAGTVPVPAMSIQPLVENAVKHGVSAVTGIGTVRVRASLRNERLMVEVADNGPGFPAGFRLGGSGHGLRNVAERMERYFGGSARLVWESAGKVTRVHVEMPILVTTHASADRG
jgi:signal transduction histidine kinase